MPTRGLLILFVITVVTVAACWMAIDKRYQNVALEKQEGGLVFPEFRHQVSTIAEIEVARAGGRFSLSHLGFVDNHVNGWANMEIGGYPAQSARIEKLIEAIAGLKYLESKTQRSKLHHKLEVEDVSELAKSTQLTIKDNAGTVLADIIIGKIKENISNVDRPEDRPGMYMRHPGDERVWLVDNTLDARYDAIDWSDRLVVDIDASMLMALTLKHADGGIVALHRNQAQDRKMTLKSLPAGATIKHQHQIDYMAGLLQKMRFSDAKRIVKDDRQLSPDFEAIVQLKDHLTVILRASESKGDGSLWTQIDVQVSDNAQTSEGMKQAVDRLKSNFSGWSVKLPRTVMDRLKIRLNDIVE